MIRYITISMFLGLALISSQAVALEAESKIPAQILELIGDHRAAQPPIFIVMMDEPPAASYEGDNPQFERTRPRHGRKLNTRSAAVRNYRSHLRGRHDKIFVDSGVDPENRVYDYTVAFNGFAANLTTEEAATIARQPGVALVVRGNVYQLHTDNSPKYLGLTASGGPWVRGFDGEDVVVGILDTGIWPEHPSFADDGSFGPAPDSFNGSGCDFGNEDFNSNDSPFVCNNKLLVARSFGLAIHGGTGASLPQGEYLSARDANGHGSHTASTAAGNSEVMASIFGQDFGVISGIAPRARIAAYKTCWPGCHESDIVAAIEQAVSDGVDVLNLSLGGAFFPNLGPMDIALLGAVEAGVFVAVSAGNEGPRSESVGGPAWSPWVTTVGASNQDRTFEGTVALENGVQIMGASIAGETDLLTLVDAQDAGDLYCRPGQLDASVVSGKIVLCRGGLVARTEKSRAVSLAGGLGTVIFNPDDTRELFTVNHFAPTVHVKHSDGIAIKRYIIATHGQGRAQLSGGLFANIQAPLLARFSSRGPNLWKLNWRDKVQDIIKPDVTAPGHVVLAANSPTPVGGVQGQYFQAISGTSMSSPHVAGIFALLKQAHPDWTPAMAKSALMTTAHQDVLKRDSFIMQANPFDIGAGQIVPGGEWSKQSIDEPGIVYNTDSRDYRGFLCGVAPHWLADPATECDSLSMDGVSFDPPQLNLPSIGVSDLAGSRTIRRTITSVSKERGWRTYIASVDAPDGYEMTVFPSSVRLRNGQSVSYDITIRQGPYAELDEWRFGSLTWSEASGEYQASSPVAVKAIGLETPQLIEATGQLGTLSFGAKFGYSGPYLATGSGLATPTILNVPTNALFVVGAINVSDSSHLRLSMSPEDFEPGVDLLLCVTPPDGDMICSDSRGITDERIDIVAPSDGIYDISILNISMFVGGNGGTTDGNLNYWVVPSFGSENLLIESAPTSAVIGQEESVVVSWSGLAANENYLGVVSHHDASGVMQTTPIAVDTR